MPSSFIISQMTPAGVKPASRAISTTASVCPALTKLPPSLATSGKTCPGVTISSLPRFSSVATEIVCARSCAEIPVVTPSLASIDTVKAVSCRPSLRRLINDNPNCSTRDFCIAKQIKPRACIAIKFITSGEAICAGIQRSPSFSRFSSSTSMKIRPCFASSITSSIDDNAPLSTSLRFFGPSILITFF